MMKVYGMVGLNPSEGLPHRRVAHTSGSEPPEVATANPERGSGCAHVSLRKAFVATYDGRDVLAEFHEQILRQVEPEQQQEIPEVPSKGDL